jgi:hypothetical protein
MKNRYIPITWLTPEEFNKKVDIAKLLNRKIKIDYSITRVNMTITRGNFVDRYSVDLIEGEKPVINNIGWVAAMFKKIVPVIKSGYGRQEIPAPTFEMPGHTKILWDYLDPGNFSYTNDKYKLKKLKCYSYDLNSAYSFAMLKPMPDTDHPKFDDIVGPGEIGFRKNTILVPVVGEGRHADVVFKLIESPYKAFVDKYYSLKENEPHGSQKRAYYKQILNITSGLLHRYNIFHRLMVLYYAKMYIQKFIDENTVYCNVDSIVSTKKRSDIPASNKIGDFKLEHSGDIFKFKQVAIYQWNDEIHYSGIPSKAINDIEDVKNINQFTKYYYEEGYIWPIKNKIKNQVDL